MNQGPILAPARRPSFRAELLPLTLAVLGSIAAAVALLRIQVPAEWVPYARVVARSHPLVVHFPIALFSVALLFDIVRRKTDGECGDSAYSTLLVGVLGAVVASFAGWLHGAFEPHSDAMHEAIDAHRWWAIGATVLALLAAVVGYAYRTTGEGGLLPFWRVGLIGSVLAVSVGGHLGGNLVYGEGFLLEPLEKLRTPAVTTSGAASDPAASATSTTLPPAAADPAASAPGDLGAPVDFATQLKPLLDQHCIECHGETKKKGRLRLDQWTERIAGGKNAVIVPGKPDDSDLLRRMLLPPDHEDFMPPEKPPLPAEQIDLFRRFIAQGAAWPKPSTPPAPQADDANNGGEK